MTSTPSVPDAIATRNKQDQREIFAIGLTTFRALDPSHGDITQKWSDSQFYLTELQKLLERLIAALSDPASDPNARVDIARAIAVAMAIRNSSIQAEVPTAQATVLMWLRDGVARILTAGEGATLDLSRLRLMTTLLTEAFHGL